MENRLISIIVPVYCVEKYLERCIRSLVKQTYYNLEILLIDDGSPDECGKICDFWAREDVRIKSFHKRNGGLSDARNYGLKFATGDYVLFVDSDDYLYYDAVRLLHEVAVRHECDVVCGNYQRTTNDCCDFAVTSEIVFYDNGAEACKAMMTDKPYMTTAWCKLISASLAKRFAFPAGRFQEDEATTYKYYFYSKKTAVLSSKIYGYYVNPNGIMKSGQNEKKNSLDLLQALEERAVFFESERQYLLCRYVHRKYTREYLRSIGKNFKEYDSRAFKKIIKKDLGNKTESKRFKLFLALVLIFGRRILWIKYR